MGDVVCLMMVSQLAIGGVVLNSGLIRLGKVVKS